MILWAFLVLLGSCSEKTADPPIPEVYVPKADLVLHPNEGKWYYENEPFNGYAITYHDNGGMEEKIGYYQGKKEGPAQQWFENGVMGSEMSYSANKIQGSKRTWWPNGVMSSEAYFDYGVVTGVQKSWYATGQIARLTTVKDGKPEGIQQAWLQNGKIYANFEVKNDRIYGMKRSNLCYSLSDEKITNESVENLDDSLDTDIL
ncbi:toxin-antitoxin system YwqK family antitoxin [Algoriphagus jejuensis]|uniref:toxin-antitoxin system YwqK family antitoxin n=1 Tax=Algoriphagus jejuensis TaxID=419934 RepID=UPI0031DC2D4E